jgi:hypothetical protein
MTVCSSHGHFGAHGRGQGLADVAVASDYLQKVAKSSSRDSPNNSSRSSNFKRGSELFYVIESSVGYPCLQQRHLACWGGKHPRRDFDHPLTVATSLSDKQCAMPVSQRKH